MPTSYATLIDVRIIGRLGKLGIFYLLGLFLAIFTVRPSGQKSKRPPVVHKKTKDFIRLLIDDLNDLRALRGARHIEQSIAGRQIEKLFTRPLKFRLNRQTALKN